MEIPMLFDFVRCKFNKVSELYICSIKVRNPGGISCRGTVPQRSEGADDVKAA